MSSVDLNAETLRTQRRRELKKLLCLVCLILAASVLGNAQTSRSPRDVVVESNRQEMDSLLLRKPILPSSDMSARMALLKQIGNDFRELQKVNNKMMEKSTAPGETDYKNIASMLGQINGIATRLKTNLALPEVEVDKRKSDSLKVDESDQFKVELTKLDQTIMSFSTNPIFQKSKVVDVQFATRASADLSSIIEQSLRLKKASSKLAKKN